MSAAYEREEQNNSLLNDLSTKVSALRSVTVNIYDNARDQNVLDNTNDTFSSMTTSVKNSATRMTRMAQQGNRVAILKLAGILVAIVIVLYFVLGFLFSLGGGSGGGGGAEKEVGKGAR